MIFGEIKRIDDLLDGDGAAERDDRDPGADEHAHDGRKRTAEPRAHDGDDVQQAGDAAERRVVRDADGAEQNDAAHADDGALQKRALDVAAHDARERDVQHFQILVALRVDEAHAFASKLRKLHEDPESHHQREPERNERVDQTRPNGDHAVGAIAGEREAHETMASSALLIHVAPCRSEARRRSACTGRAHPAMV